MKTHIRGISASIAIAGVGAIALALTAGAAPLSASRNPQRDFRATKACPDYRGQAGQHCTITSSSLADLVGAQVYYDQALGIPAGMLDSNVLLDAGYGNRAVGRCTLQLPAGPGLCTFSDGTGTLAGFHARADVSLNRNGTWEWEGTYGFARDDDNSR